MSEYQPGYQPLYEWPPPAPPPPAGTPSDPFDSLAVVPLVMLGVFLWWGLKR